VVRGARGTAGTRRPGLARWVQSHPERPSWAVWAISIVCFAAWMRAHPALLLPTPETALVIHSIFYAMMALMMREWFAIRWARRHDS
jgi:hypothetical protein